MIYHTITAPIQILLINAVCLEEKQQIPILQSLAWPDQSFNPWYTHTQGEYYNYKWTDNDY